MEKSQQPKQSRKDLKKCLNNFIEVRMRHTKDGITYYRLSRTLSLSECAALEVAQGTLWSVQLAVSDMAKDSMPRDLLALQLKKLRKELYRRRDV